MAEHIDLASWEPAYTENPYPLLARLREQAPVTKVVIDGLSVWLVTRYDDIRAGLADSRLSSDPRLGDEVTRAVPWVGASSDVSRHMGRMDPPDHPRLRRLVAKAFTPRRIEALRPRIQQIADELVAVIRPRGRADLLAEFALPLPLTVISELLGVSTMEQQAFVHWVNILIGMDEGDVERVPEARAWLGDYLVRLIKHKELGQTERSADAEQGCLLDGLIAAREEGERLTSNELVAMSYLLLIAGYETTVGLIGNGLLSLMLHPEQCAALRADPELIKPAVEEVLRCEASVKVIPFVRITTTEVTLGGVVIPAQQPVMFALAAANHDPAYFSDPDRFDISRAERGHLAFGHGIHACLGAPLARLEAEIAITTLLAGCPDLALVADPAALPWRHSRMLRSLKCLPVTFTAPAAMSSPGAPGAPGAL